MSEQDKIDYKKGLKALKTMIDSNLDHIDQFARTKFVGKNYAIWNTDTGRPIIIMKGGEAYVQRNSWYLDYLKTLHENCVELDGTSMLLYVTNASRLAYKNVARWR